MPARIFDTYGVPLDYIYLRLFGLGGGNFVNYCVCSAEGLFRGVPMWSPITLSSRFTPIKRSLANFAANDKSFPMKASSYHQKKGTPYFYQPREIWRRSFFFSQPRNLWFFIFKLNANGNGEVPKWSVAKSAPTIFDTRAYFLLCFVFFFYINGIWCIIRLDILKFALEAS